jgi:hypothetical protein
VDLGTVAKQMRPKETTFFVWGRGSKGHFVSFGWVISLFEILSKYLQPKKVEVEILPFTIGGPSLLCR